MEYKTFIAIGPDGKPIPNPSVTVFVAGTSLATPAAIYDFAGNLITQPLIGSNQGKFGFRTAEWQVDVKSVNPANSAVDVIQEVLFQPPVRFDEYDFASAAGPFTLPRTPNGLLSILFGDGAEINRASFTITGNSLAWVGGFDYTLFSNYRLRYAY